MHSRIKKTSNALREETLWHIGCQIWPSPLTCCRPYNSLLI